MNQTDELWLLCERKRLLSWIQNYICLLTGDALYICKKPRGVDVSWNGRHAVPDMDRDRFMSNPGLKRYSRENVENYRFFVSYDESQPDITPIDEVEKYAAISFRDKVSGKKLVLRCANEIQEVKALANRIFA